VKHLISYFSTKNYTIRQNLYVLRQYTYKSIYRQTYIFLNRLVEKDMHNSVILDKTSQEIHMISVTYDFYRATLYA